MNERVVAHVGFHKTGSTLLQEKVFVPEFGFCSPWPIGFHIDNVVMRNPFLVSLDDLRDAYRPGLQEAGRSGLVPLISHEALLGNPFEGVNRYATTAHVEQLFGTFPGLHVVVVIREQRSMLASLYRHSISAALTWDQRSFLSSRTYGIKSFKKEFLEYSWPLLRLVEVLGRDRVNVVPFELLAVSPDEFFAPFERLGGVSIPAEKMTKTEVNPGLSVLEAKVKRIGNRFLPNDPDRRVRVDARLRRVSRLAATTLGSAARARAKRGLDDAIGEAVGDRYRESNQRVADCFGLDLERLGYAV